MYAFSAAHTLLPLPSYARVTNVANGKSVVVRVNDRGPFHGDRLIDLSYAAAHRIGIVGQGSAMVEVEALIPGSGGAPPVPASAPVVPAPVAVPVSIEAGSMFVQLGAFSVEENADAFLRKMRLDLRLAGQFDAAVSRRRPVQSTCGALPQSRRGRARRRTHPAGSRIHTLCA